MIKRALPLLVLLSGCAPGPGLRFARLRHEFVYTTLSFSPIAATAAGLHRYQDRNLDVMLDDVSAAGFDRQRRYYRDFQARLEKEVRRDALPPEDRADCDILHDQVALALLELDEIRNYLHNPTYYVELVGAALFTPYVQDYAPARERAGHIIARLRALPSFLDSAILNLDSAPSIWTRVAIQENAGNFKLIEQSVKTMMQGDQAGLYVEASGPALDALHKFDDFLRNGLSRRNNWDWRLGREKYEKKFRYMLAAGVLPAELLRSAIEDLQAVRARMLATALQLDGGGRPGAIDAKRQNAVISAALDRIAERHATREGYITEAKGDLEEARAFVQRRRLLTLPARDNLRVIETPEFMRGIYAVGGFNPAPPLEPRLGAYYWITPIPPDWPAARAESKLREYNSYKLMLLTMHEAIPGHYVQAEYADQVEPESRRLLRSLYGNGAYVEGWAQYATAMMLDGGFHSSPEMQLTFDKERLRVLANAIMDIRLQTAGMTDQEALDLMQRDTFQENEEAHAKLQRAKLSSCQLTTYYAGWKGWDGLRDSYRRMEGSGFRLRQFHDAALREGAVPLPVLERLLTGR